MRKKIHKQTERRPEADLFKQVRAVQLTSRKRVDDHLSGDYQSAFKGRGMEFDQVREYVAGDDPRHIDWMVTARSGHPFIKTFVEERELSVFFVIDGSASRQFGTTEKTEFDRSIELFATLGLSGMRKNDALGLLIFTDQVEVFIPPKKGKKHFLRLIRELLNFAPQSTGTDISAVLEYCNKALKRRGVLFLISDFFDPHDFSKPLRHLAKHHDLVAIETKSDISTKLTQLGLLNIEGLEDKKACLLDPTAKTQGSSFSKSHFFKALGADHLEILETKKLDQQLSTFFRQHVRRR